MIMLLQTHEKNLVDMAIYEHYRAQICERYSRWKDKARHDAIADDIMNEVFEDLHIDPQLHEIKIDRINSIITATPRINVSMLGGESYERRC